MAGIFSFTLLLFLLLLLPPVQSILTNKASGWVREKFGIKIKIERLYVRPPETILLDGLYLQDEQKDTLLYAGKLRISAGLFDLFQKKINVKTLRIENLTAKMSRQTGDSVYNFQFIIDAFSSKTGKPKLPPEKPWTFDAGEILLRDIRFTMDDQYIGTFLTANLQKGRIETDKLDPAQNEMRFKDIDLKGFHGFLQQPDSTENTKDTAVVKPRNPETASAGLLLASGNVVLEDIHFVMNRPGSKFYLHSGLEYLRSENPLITLGNLHISIKDLYARKLTGKMEINEQKDTAEVAVNSGNPARGSPDADKAADHLFGDFDLIVRLGHGKIENSYFSMEYPDVQPLKTFDYHHMELKGVNFDLKDAMFYNDGVKGRIGSIKATERSGLTLENFTANVIFNNQTTVLKNLSIQTPKSLITGNISLEYPSMKALKTNPGKVNIDIHAEASVGSQDLAHFISHESVSYPDSIQIKEYRLNIQTSGRLNNIKLTQFKLEAGKDMKLEASGIVKGLPDIKNTYANIRIDTVYASLETIQAFTGSDSLPGNIKPGNMLRGNAFLIGSPDSAQFRSELYSDKGFLKAGAELRKNGNRYYISSKSVFAMLQAGALTGISQLGITSGTLNAGLVADSTGILTSQAALIIDSISYNGYQYRNVQMDFSSDGTHYELKSKMKAPEIAYELEAAFSKNDFHQHLEVDIQVNTMDLPALNLFNGNIIVSGNIHSVLDYHDKNEYFGNIEIDNLLLKNARLRYPVNKIRYDAKVDSTNNYYEIVSDILHARLTGNVKLIDIPDLVANHIMAYIHGQRTEYDNSPHFDMELKLSDPEILTEIIFPELESFSLESLTAHYDDSSKHLSANIRIPDLKYSDIQLNTMLFDLNSTEKELSGTFFVNRFSYDSLMVDSLDWNVTTKGNQIFSRLTIGDTLQRRYDLGIRLDLKDSMRILSFIPGQISSNGIPWAVPEGNRILIHRPEINAESVSMESTAGNLTIEASNSDIRILFRDFMLRNLTGIFNNPGIEQLISGKINGSVQIENIFINPVYGADLQINRLKSMGSNLGDLKAVLKQPADTSMNFDIRLTSAGNNLFSNATIGTGVENGLLDIKTNWEFRNPEVFQPWISKYIKSVNGIFKGNIAVSGTRKQPVPAGNIHFEEFNIDLALTNTHLRLPNESITLDTRGLHFGNFHLYDSLGNSMVLRGDMLTEDYRSFKFNLNLNTDRFLIINNTKEDLKSLYGKIMIATNIKLTGQSGSPVVDSRLDILKETDITYALAGSDLTLQDDEGVVVYSDKDLSPDSLVVSKVKLSVADSLAGKITGLKQHTDLAIDENAQFTLVTNPTGGDYAKFKMSGRLVYEYNPSQSGLLTGKIMLKEGIYELSFYGLIHKKFTLVPGSYVNWSGAVMDGNINFQAKYIVKSNSVGLVGAEVTEAEKAKYNQRLPYEVLLEIKGLLSDPKITFHIDLPETYLSGQPLIESKLQSLNQEGMENERNRQALALLVGGTFIPENTAESSGQELGFATTAAMNTMNSIITQQLNNLSGMFIKGMEINMGINRIDHYGGQTAGNNTRTQLDIGVNKYFMENRILVGVEGHFDLEGNNPAYQNNTSTMTEFIVEYLLTKNGNYRIKAFRENAFDLIDGEIQNTGLAFIFVIDLGKKPGKKQKKDRDNKR